MTTLEGLLTDHFDQPVPVFGGLLRSGACGRGAHQAEGAAQAGGHGAVEFQSVPVFGDERDVRTDDAGHVRVVEALEFPATRPPGADAHITGLGTLLQLFAQFFDKFPVLELQGRMHLVCE